MGGGDCFLDSDGSITHVSKVDLLLPKHEFSTLSEINSFAICIKSANYTGNDIKSFQIRKRN